MREFQEMAQCNAAIRGYILRTLVKGMRHCLSVRRLSRMLQEDGFTTEPDIGTYLDYLYELEYIKFTDPSIKPHNAYALDAVVGLAHKGIRFIESGGELDAGIEL